MSIHIHQFDNGMTLVAEELRSLESAAFCFLVPVGSAYDPPARAGLTSFVCEMVQRGCGSMSSRQFLDALELLGVEGSESVSLAHTTYGGATLADNLLPALSIYADLLLRPHLPPEQLEAGRLVSLQELRGVEDEPAQKAMLELRRRHYPAPWGQPSIGDVSGLQATTIDDVRRQFAQGYRPGGTILGVAGKFDWQALKSHVGELFSGWSVADLPEPGYGPRGATRDHIPFESNQTHICLAYDSVPLSDPDYFRAWGAVHVLSGGSSSRLFSEVREKRGLCYTVYAQHRLLRDRGIVTCYAGTSADRAQETLDVTMAEIERLYEGVEADELDRLQARMKSGLLMQQESSSSRSMSIAYDWYHLGRVRDLAEVSRCVEELTPESINSYLVGHPIANLTLLTLGPKPLEAPHGVS